MIVPKPTFRTLAVLLSILALALSGTRVKAGPLSPEFRKAFGIEDHYQQVVFVEEFPILASAKVRPEALDEAAHNIRSMLAARTDILHALSANKIRFGIMAVSERTCDLPEHSKLQPKAFWNRRARGLGATRKAPCVSCGEENLLHNPGDQYPTESIMIHEFAHAIHHIALKQLDPTFDIRLRQAYEEAMKAGRWRGLYAAQNRDEFWAEGVQSWFDANRENDAIHNHVNTRDELVAYDPPLARLCKEVFKENQWRYKRADDPARKHETHLKNLDRTELQPFKWSGEEQSAFDRLEDNPEKPDKTDK